MRGILEHTNFVVGAGGERFGAATTASSSSGGSSRGGCGECSWSCSSSDCWQELSGPGNEGLHLVLLWPAAWQQQRTHASNRSSSRAGQQYSNVCKAGERVYDKQVSRCHEIPQASNRLQRLHCNGAAMWHIDVPHQCIWCGCRGYLSLVPVPCSQPLSDGVCLYAV